MAAWCAAVTSHGVRSSSPAVDLALELEPELELHLFVAALGGHSAMLRDGKQSEIERSCIFIMCCDRFPAQTCGSHRNSHARATTWPTKAHLWHKNNVANLRNCTELASPHWRRECGDAKRVATFCARRQTPPNERKMMLMMMIPKRLEFGVKFSCKFGQLYCATNQQTLNTPAPRSTIAIL